MSSSSLGASSVLSHLKVAFMVILQPQELFQTHLQHYPWPWALGISGSAFGLFFLQTGLDLVRTGRAGGGKVAALAALGVLYGTAGVALLALLAWILSRPWGGGHSVGWVLRAFGLGYSAALVYGLLGLLANLLLGWNTALAFGVTGVLWALGPMLAAVKEMTAGKTGVSIVLATLCGVLVLLGWAWLSAW